MVEETQNEPSQEVQAAYTALIEKIQKIQKDPALAHKMAMNGLKKHQLTPENDAWLKAHLGPKPATSRPGMRGPVNFDDLPKPDVIPVNDELYQNLIQRAQRVLSKDNPELAVSLEHFAKTVQNLHQNILPKLKLYVEKYNEGKLPTNIYFEPKGLSNTYVHHLKDVVAQNTIQGLGGVWAMLVADFNGAAELALSLDDAAFKQFAVSVSAGCFEACIDAANEWKASQERKAKSTAGSKIEVRDVREALEKGMGLIQNQKPEYAEDVLAALDKVVKIRGLDSLPKDEVMAQLNEIYGYESKANQEKEAQVVAPAPSDSVMPNAAQKNMFTSKFSQLAREWDPAWGEPSFESVFNKAQEQYNQRFNNVGHLKMTDANYVALKADPQIQQLFVQAQMQTKAQEAKQEQAQAKVAIQEAKQEKAEAKQLLTSTTKIEKKATNAENELLRSQSQQDIALAKQAQIDAREKEAAAKRALDEARSKQLEVERMAKALKQKQEQAEKEAAKLRKKEEKQPQAPQPQEQQRAKATQAQPQVKAQLVKAQQVPNDKAALDRMTWDDFKHLPKEERQLLKGNARVRMAQAHKEHMLQRAKERAPMNSAQYYDHLLELVEKMPIDDKRVRVGEGVTQKQYMRNVILAAKNVDLNFSQVNTKISDDYIACAKKNKAKTDTEDPYSTVYQGKGKQKITIYGHKYDPFSPTFGDDLFLALDTIVTNFSSSYNFSQGNALEQEWFTSSWWQGCFDGAASNIAGQWLMIEAPRKLQSKDIGTLLKSVANGTLDGEILPKTNFTDVNNFAQVVLGAYGEVVPADNQCAEHFLQAFIGANFTIVGKPLFIADGTVSNDVVEMLDMMGQEWNIEENKQKPINAWVQVVIASPAKADDKAATVKAPVVSQTAEQMRAKQAEQERAKAEQERAKAEQERAKAEQERAKAEQERSKAEQVRERLAEQERARQAEQEAKAKAQAEQARAKQEKEAQKQREKEERERQKAQEKQDKTASMQRQPSANLTKSFTGKFQRTTSMKPGSDTPVFTSFDKMQIPKKYNDKQKIDNKAGKLLYKLNDGKIFWKAIKGGNVKTPGEEQGREVAGAWVANHITNGAVPRSHLREVDSKLGIAQDYVNIETFNSQAIKQLNKKQVAQILAHLIADKAVSNYDAHLDNYGLDKDGNVIGIDKGEAFRFFQRGKVGFKSSLHGAGSDDDKINLDQYGPSDINFYKQVFELVKNGDLEVDFDDPLVQDALVRCTSLTFEDVQQMYSGYAQTKFKNNKARQEEFYKEVHQRLQNMPQALANFRQQISPQKDILQEPTQPVVVQQAPRVEIKVELDDKTRSSPIPIAEQARAESERASPPQQAVPVRTQQENPAQAPARPHQDKPAQVPARHDQEQPQRASTHGKRPVAVVASPQQPAANSPAASKPQNSQELKALEAIKNILNTIDIQDTYNKSTGKKGFVSYYLKRQRGDRPKQIELLQKEVNKSANAIALMRGELAYMKDEDKNARLLGIFKQLDDTINKVEQEMKDAHHKFKGTSRMEHVLGHMRHELDEMRKIAKPSDKKTGLN
ncbi:MAG: hypothetical protein AB7V32_03235 [Candidatus Berkiella sp.]